MSTVSNSVNSVNSVNSFNSVNSVNSVICVNTQQLQRGATSISDGIFLLV